MDGISAGGISVGGISAGGYLGLAPSCPEQGANKAKVVVLIPGWVVHLRGRLHDP